MHSLHDLSPDTAPALAAAGRGFIERRGRAPGGQPNLAAQRAPAVAAGDPRLGQVLDMLDYGLVLLAHDGRVDHLNKTARRELERGHPLQVVDGRLHTAQARDAAALREAVGQATLRGLRRLLVLGQGSQRASVAVVPLPPVGTEVQHGVALLMARRQVCEQLTVEWFARSHGLTLAETTVVKGLCADLTPVQIAEQQGVGLATVRTQIGSIRLKTGAGSIRALMRQVALLPPLVSVLHGLLGPTSASGTPSALPSTSAHADTPAPLLC